ncbi:MAG: LysR family transcriptional regulator [Nitriliruptorales bacterium]|nr:LysR family transcriptional regulator [Nitriliruptorales bacterium]
MATTRRVRDLGRLELFVAVVELGSLSRAAARQGISQPSASVAIARLERQLGVALLRRTSTGSVATEHGKRVYDCARTFLAAADALEDALDGLAAHRDRRLDIAASYTVAEYVLPQWLTAMRRSDADVELRVAVDNSTQVMNRVLNGDADIGFVEGDDIAHGLTAEAVGEDDLVVVVSSAHPWSMIGRPLSISELASTRLVTREAGSGTREVAEHRLAEHCSDTPAPLLELGSTTTVKKAVIDGAGPAIMSRLTVEAELADGRLREVTVPGIDLRRTFRAVWPATSGPPPWADRLLRVCR